MFKTGTHVIVLSSSFSGGTGPKIGSIGYTSGKGPVYFDDQSSLFVLPQEVIFTRYGFESKTRKERKKFIVALPACQSFSPQDREDVLRKELARARNIENEVCETISFLKLSNQLKSAPVGILAPTPKVDLRRTSQNERLAWLESQVRSEEILSIVEDMLARYGKVANGFSHKFLNNLFLMNTNRNARQKIIASLEDRKIISNFIMNFQRFLSVGMQDFRRERLEDLKDWLEDIIVDNYNEERQLLKALIGILFSHDFEELSKLVMPKVAIGTSSKVFFMEGLRSELVSRARILEDTRNPKSITVNP